MSRSTGISSSNDPSGSGETVLAGIRSAGDPELTFQRDYYRVQEGFRIEIADRIWQLRRDYLARNHHRQARLARTFCSFSPAAVYADAAAVLAGTGFERHRAFVQAARRYRERFVAFVREKGREDRDSPHVYLVKEGLSARPVDSGEIPPFIDRASLAAALSDIAPDAGILLGLCVLLFACAYVSFLCYDPR